MDRLFACMLSVCLLAGCGLAQIQQDRAAATGLRDTQLDQCDRSFPVPLRKPVLPRIKCYNDAHLNYAHAKDGSVGNANLDLVTLLTARMRLAGEQYDSGKLTEAQFEVEEAAILSEYKSKVAQRRNDSTMVRAARDQADAAAKPVQCDRIGSSVYCR